MQSSRGYSQYPFDSTASMFQSYNEYVSADSHIIVHRHPSLVYYTYLRRLTDENGMTYFGVSILVNGLETRSFKSLFRLFERVFQRMVSDENILKISPQGDFVCCDYQITSYAKYLNELSTTIEKYVNEGESTFVPMFPLNVSTGINDYCQISLGARDLDILSKLQTYNKLIITKDTSSSNAGLKGLALKIENLNQQLEYQKERNEELQKIANGKGVDGGWKMTALAFISITIVVLLIILYGVTSGLLTINI